MFIFSLHVSSLPVLLFCPLVLEFCFCVFWSIASVSLFSIFLSCFFFILLIFVVFLICDRKGRQTGKRTNKWLRYSRFCTFTLLFLNLCDACLYRSVWWMDIFDFDITVGFVETVILRNSISQDCWQTLLASYFNNVMSPLTQSNIFRFVQNQQCSFTFTKVKTSFWQLKSTFGCTIKTNSLF